MPVQLAQQQGHILVQARNNQLEKAYQLEK